MNSDYVVLSLSYGCLASEISCKTVVFILGKEGIKIGVFLYLLSMLKWNEFSVSVFQVGEKKLDTVPKNHIYVLMVSNRFFFNLLPFYNDSPGDI